MSSDECPTREHMTVLVDGGWSGLKYLAVGFLLALSASVLAGLSRPQAVQAQSREGWSEPVRLSSDLGDASAARLVRDGGGGLHAFWSESGFEHDRSLILYSGFNGAGWSEPTSVYASWPGSPVTSVAADIDREGIVHLFWSEGTTGPVFYSTVEVEAAADARAWSDPRRINLPALELRAFVDDQGWLHIVYANFYGDEPGIYYARSVSAGKSWSYPTWIDPDIPATAAPSWIDAGMDHTGGLHVTWSYSDLAVEGATSRWIRYARSMNGGESWEPPVTMDLADDSFSELRMPNPGLAVSESQVHVIWGADNQLSEGVTSGPVNRRHRFSRDYGQTWSEANPILDSLEGQAIGDGLGFDAQRNLHMVAQLRWPQAVYHAVWDGDAWSEAVPVYVIRQDSSDEFRDRVHAHNVRLGRSGEDQMVISFTVPPGSPQSVLYAIHERLPPDQVPTPSPATTATPTELAATEPPATATPTGREVTALPTVDPSSDASSTASSVAMPIWLGVVPAGIFVLLVVLGWVIVRR